ncbi:MAG: VOC family protein [Acidobacteriota bacterium]|nr:VOC family protein [Acidobacteriota bacterium]
MSARKKLRLHHVGYATKDIGPSVEAYTARFGYEAATSVIHDPLQTALVQFLHLPGEPTYLEFVAPDGPQSKLVEVAKRGGALNHLCYTSGPLEATIADLEHSGMKLISDPKPAIAFAGRRICWLLGADSLPIELVERRDESDACPPGL